MEQKQGRSKRVLSGLLAISLVLSLAACQPAGDSSTVNSNVTSSEESMQSESSASAVTTSSQHITSIASGQASSKSVSSTNNGKESQSMKASDYILDKSVFATRYRDKGFESYNDYGRNLLIPDSYNKMDPELHEKSLKELGLGSLYYPPVDTAHMSIGEWGMSFLGLNGTTSAFNLKIEGAGWKEYQPSSRTDALGRIKNWLFKQFSPAPYNLQQGTTDISSINGHTFWEHYAGEFGFDYLGAEIGESVASHQTHMAFTRGASRQYSAVPLMYFSNWFEGRIGTFQDVSSWGEYGAATYGHSMNLIERTFLMSYMGGAGSFTFEAGSILAFYGPNSIDYNGLYNLTPYGDMMKKMIAFSKENPDIGYTYTPIGIVLDKYHGLMNIAPLRAAGCTDGPFGYFEMNAGDQMNIDLISMYFPNGYFSRGDTSQYGSPNRESTYQVNNRYGDTCDFLLQNASQKVLNSYPCILLSGDIKFSDAEAKRYIEYVKQGGTLLLNTAYLKYFPQYQSKYNGAARQNFTDGKGTVIVYGKDFSVKELDDILKEQLKRFVPFAFSKDVQYLVNVKDGSMIVTVINNDGVEKMHYQMPTFDDSKVKDITITYTGKTPLKSVKELFYHETVKQNGNTVSAHLEAGGYRVFEFVFD